MCTRVLSSPPPPPPPPPMLNYSLAPVLFAQAISSSLSRFGFIGWIPVYWLKCFCRPLPLTPNSSYTRARARTQERWELELEGVTTGGVVFISELGWPTFLYGHQQYAHESVVLCINTHSLKHHIGARGYLFKLKQHFSKTTFALQLCARVCKWTVPKPSARSWPTYFKSEHTRTHARSDRYACMCAIPTSTSGKSACVRTQRSTLLWCIRGLSLLFFSSMWSLLCSPFPPVWVSRPTARARVCVCEQKTCFSDLQCFRAAAAAACTSKCGWRENISSS